MKIDENWFKLYEKLYGETFNRLITIGNNETGYTNYPILNLEELAEKINEFENTEFYISLYNYLTDENIIRWDNTNINKFEEYAEKNYILFRFRQDTSVIQEEVSTLNEIQKFMFIRRSINLGFNKEIIMETQKTYNFFKTHFNIKGILMFNGYNECLLYYPKKDLKLKRSSLTYYNLLKLVQEKLELNTLIFENIEPYAQLVPLPGTQNKNSRLYVQLYYPDFSYKEIMKNSENKYFNTEYLTENEYSDKLHDFIISMDKETHAHERDSKYDFEEIWDNIWLNQT